MTPSHIVHVGFGNMVRSDLIKCILPPTSANARRLLKSAKENSTYLDMTSGHPAKCLLLQQDGSVIGCAQTAKTVVSRFSEIQEEKVHENS